MIGRKSLFILLLGCGILGASAHADGLDAQVAARHFHSGSKLYQAGRYADALREFQSGFAADPLPGFWVNIGQCQRKLERFDDAAASFHHFLDSNDQSPALRAQVRDALAEIERDRPAPAPAAPAPTAPALAAPPEAPPEAPPPAVELSVPPPASATPVATAPPLAVRADAAVPPPAHSHRRWWVWTLVGVAAAGAAAGITLGVLYTQSPSPQAGSLGLLDGRR